MIEFKTYNKYQLKNLIDSAEFKNFVFLPISRHRGLSQINNPRAKEEDILLIIAFEGEEIAAYLGILPDDFFSENEKIHCGWLSTIFVDPKFRGKRIAQQLLEIAFEAYNGHILITEFTTEAENMYVKTQKFDIQKPLVGMNFYFLFNLQKVLSTKKVLWEKFSPLLKIVDFSANFLLKISYSFKKINPKESQTFKLDEEISSFIEKNQVENSFKRSIAEIKWITNNPWILVGVNKDFNYQFSAFDKNFEYLFLKIYKENKLSSVLFLSLRNKTLKLQRLFGTDYEDCANVLLNYILKCKIINFISFDDNINSLMDGKFSLFKKARFRKFMMHKSLTKNLSENFQFNVTALDADAVFT